MQFLFSLIPNKSFPIIFEDSERFISKVFIGYSGSILFVVLFGLIVFGINLFSFIINGEKSGLIKFENFLEVGFDTGSEDVIFF